MGTLNKAPTYYFLVNDSDKGLDVSNWYLKRINALFGKTSPPLSVLFLRDWHSHLGQVIIEVVPLVLVLWLEFRDAQFELVCLPIGRLLQRLEVNI